MKVKANLQGKRLGFVNGRRVRDGEVFEVSQKDYTPTWMIKIEEKKKPGPKPKEPEVIEPVE